MRTFDHLIVGVANLDDGLDWFAATTGIRPARGGAHPELGTTNALVSLGAESYLELLAPDPHAGAGSSPVATALAALQVPTPVGWSVQCTDAASAAQSIRAAGYDAAASPYQRMTPSGEVLRWDIVLLTHGLGPIIPFLIDWGAAASPAATAPGGCELLTFSGTHPDPEAAQQVLDLLMAPMSVAAGPGSGLRIRLATPRGVVEIGS